MGKRSSIPTWFKLVALGAVGIVSFTLAATALFAPAPASTYVRPPSTQTPDATPTEEAPLRVAFLGDSYAEGAGSSTDRQNRWTTVVSRELGWTESNLSVGGTGYSQGDDRNYQARVSDVIADSPDVVIVSGGRNDWAIDQSAQGAAVAAVFTALREGLPDAQIIAISPWWDDDAVPTELDTLTGLVQEGVEGVGGTFVDGGQPLTGKPELLSEDGVHPNDEGYAALAEAVLSSLEAISS